MSKTLVIAECGSCHDGSLVQAMNLVYAAHKAGASIAKFQFWSDADRLADRRGVPHRYREIYRQYQIPEEWLSVLAGVCSSYGMEFMCTIYLPEDVAVVAPFVQRFKVASFEAMDEAFLTAHAKFNKPLIVSAGMMAEAETNRFYLGCDLLQCVSAYPAPPEAMNLAVLWRGDSGPSPFTGISDHSRHRWMGALAVAAGAEIIEAHLRLDDTDPENPDFATAFGPDEFADYVRNIRFAERVMGDGVKKLEPSEWEMSGYRVRST